MTDGPVKNIEEDQWLRQSVVGLGVAPKKLLNFGAADRLDVFEYFQFFTPAPMYLYGWFHDGPLLDYMQVEKPDLEIGYHLFEHAIFKNMDTPDGNADWNRALWGVHKDEWPGLVNFILSLTMTNPQEQEIYRFGIQKVTIADPLFLDQHTVVPSEAPVLEIYSFGVDSSKYAVAIEESDQPLTDSPRLAILPPQTQTVAFALSLFKGEGNPLTVWDDVRRLELKKDADNASPTETRAGHENTVQGEGR